MKENYIARRLEANGVVQGVGFRPFVYQLANRYSIKGEIANTSSGVSLHIEGIKADIDQFCRDFSEKCPPLAHITDITIRPAPFEKCQEFLIAKSKGKQFRTTLISPDVAVCEDCLQELFDQDDRRYKYPFINCTNCGPRYTIIDDIPYDRPNTSMKHFNMCEMCQSEYNDPANRRFHAQPNACRSCGPYVTLYDSRKNRIETDDPIKQTGMLIKEGYILAIKGLGGYHLVVDAENDAAVRRLRERKHREEKPFAVMSYDLDHVKKYADVSSEEKALLFSFQRPIVLLKKKEPNPLSNEVAPKNRYFGVMLPYTPLHYILLNQDFCALVMTSGNISEEPIAIDNGEAFERLSGIADYYLVHNRDIYLRSDDSIVRMTAGSNRYIRRSRGYVPLPIFLKKTVPQVLACGAELKNTVCLTKEKNAFLSQHIGNLENLETYSFFKMTIEHMKRILDIDPVIVACDLHPDYLSTEYAKSLAGIQLIQVQHHHAHIVSCMAENRIDGPVIGLSFDGTGYGTDGNIWGGEVIIAEKNTFFRAAALSYVPMPGSATAIKEPWRMAVSYLYDAFGPAFDDLDIPMLKAMEQSKIETIIQMITKKINSPNTSSIGRLFDGVAAILGIRNNVNFEGQAAMELEMLAAEESADVYDYEWIEEDMFKVPTAPIIKGVVCDVEMGIEPAIISSKFHMTIIRLFSDLCGLIREKKGL
ncbi:MAG: carbamoyltransferase HypF, partial [Deltaproteobacteria bacterium]|nr:carbamoyltransferase HypF [Deltaproteobacteria bacterium]